MFVDQNGIIRFEAKNENEAKLKKYFYRRNGWHGNKGFNDFKQNQDGTVTLFLKGGETVVSQEALNDIYKASKWCVLKATADNYVVGKLDMKTITLHSFLMRHELAKYEGFTEETGLKLVVNHIDEQTTNNTFDNLEVVTQSENLLKWALNSAKGHFKTNKGSFNVVVAKKPIGTFETEEEAREAYVRTVKAELKRLEEIRINWLKSKGRL